MKLTPDRITDLTPEAEFPPLSDFLSVASSGECRWPGEGIECCGRLARKHSPYCEHHHAKAFRRQTNYSDERIERLQCSGLKRMPQVQALRKPATAEELGL